MGYGEELGYLYSFEKFGVRLGLETINALLDPLGQPHKKFKSILVAGTNGKGSTCAMLGEILKEAGLKVGVYTSPEVVDLRERIAVDGEMITKGQLSALMAELKPAVEMLTTPPTFFDALTALAFMHFERAGIDIAVLEVGMGGRLDATNVVEPLVSVITNVGMDHTGFLGSTVREIAGEKAGIIKEGGTVVTAAEGEALSVIKEVCRKKHARLVKVGEDVTYRPIGQNLRGQDFEVEGKASRYSGLCIPLLGEHQLRNAATAIAAVEALGERGIALDEGAIRRGLKKARLPGRLEVVRKEPLVLLDGAHNVEGARALRRAAEELLAGRKITLIIGILEDKDIEGMAGELAPMAAHVIATKPDVERASDPERTAAAFREEGKEVEVIEEVPEALQKAGKKEVLLITGSLFTVAEARKVLR